jgi:two-component system, NtrC family, nitrogen regulation sensor histidine kinase NtrY
MQGAMMQWWDIFRGKFRSFAAVLLIRIVLLTGAITACVAAFFSGQKALGTAVALVAVIFAYRLYYTVNDTNRRLARFFESVRYSDFAVRFSAGKEKGASFEDINQQFNEVLEAFRQTRADKEANLLFLNTIVQHLSTGLLAFDLQSNVLISNSAAFQLLGVYRLHHLNDLPERHRPLAAFVRGLETKGKVLYQAEAGRQLAVQGVNLSLQGRPMRLLTLQNIHPELQRKEVDAWRNLTRVLRHEMMNSITPIVSLVETAQEIVRLDLPQNEATADLSEALDVVAARSRNLVNFVEAYRSFTAIPQPKIAEVPAAALLQRIVSLHGASKDAAMMAASVSPEDLRLSIDAGQIEMVLLNLVKNAQESFAGHSSATPPQIQLSAGLDSRSRPFICVEDNGPGIPADLLEEVFIPFFTTKPSGTGVGLSISKQILQLHGGDIRIASKEGEGTRFFLEF